MIPRPPALRKRLEDYVAARDRMVALLAHARRALDDADTVAREIGLYGLPAACSPRYALSDEGAVKEIDRRMWRHAFEHTGVMQVMDREAVQDFDRSLERDPPAFTLDNVTGVFLDQYQNADEMFVRGLVNVFGRLSGHYRSNDPFQLAPKVVLDYMVAERFDGGLEVRGYMGDAGDSLNDMDRVFRVLDGKPHQPRRLEVSINAAFAVGEVYEDDYFRIKGFKKGTLHVWFKRADLLDKGNALISRYFDGRAVPDARREAA